MSLPVPQLDNTDFDQLSEFARGLIPRFSPRWTDHNLHDPGMTLLDLVCWVVDQQIYEIGFVSDRHILAFAALLGLRPALATPAVGLVWPLDYEPPPGAPVQVGYTLSAGAVVTSSEVTELKFELAKKVFVSPARLARPDPSLVTHASLVHAAMQRRKEPLVIGGGQTPLELLFDRPLIMPGDDTDAPISIGVELASPTPPRTGGKDETGALTVDYRIEMPGETWRRIGNVEDQTLALNQSGNIYVQVPPAAAGTPAGTPSRLRIVTGERLNPLPVRIAAIAINVLPVIQRETIAMAPLGAKSNGLPDQVFDIDVTGLIDEKKVRIKLDADHWHRIDSLADAGPNEKRYEFQREQNQIVFGNGINGAIPSAGAQIIHENYCVTTGVPGNIAAGFGWSITGAALPAGQGVYGKNRMPFTGGRDPDDVNSLLPEVRKHALERLATTTNAQLEGAAEALDLLAIDRAEVLDRYDPRLPCADVPGSRTLVIVPQRAEETDATGAVPQRYIDAVRRALADRRVLGERLTVLSPERISLRVKADLILEEGVDAKSVETAAKQHLNARLADVKQPGDIEPWPTGRPVTREEIRTLLARVPGVIAVSTCELARGVDAFADCDIILPRIAIAIGGAHELASHALSERSVSR